MSMDDDTRKKLSDILAKTAGGGVPIGKAPEPRPSLPAAGYVSRGAVGRAPYGSGRESLGPAVAGKYRLKDGECQINDVLYERLMDDVVREAQKRFDADAIYAPALRSAMEDAVRRALAGATKRVEGRPWPVKVRRF